MFAPTPYQYNLKIPEGKELLSGDKYALKRDNCKILNRYPLIVFYYWFVEDSITNPYRKMEHGWR